MNAPQATAMDPGTLTQLQAPAQAAIDAGKQRDAAQATVERAKVAQGDADDALTAALQTFTSAMLNGMGPVAFQFGGYAFTYDGTLGVYEFEPLPPGLETLGPAP